MAQVIQGRKEIYAKAQKESIASYKSLPRGNPTKKLAVTRFFTRTDLMRQMRRQIQRSEGITLWTLRATRAFSAALSLADAYPSDFPELCPALYLGKPLYSEHNLQAFQEFAKCLCELTPSELEGYLSVPMCRALWGLYKRREGIVWEP